MIKVLLIEDDREIARHIKYHLASRDIYEVEVRATKEEALIAARDNFDVILLDVMLPDGNGIDLCQQLREWHDCPIIFISCLDDNSTIIQALEWGGDDYIVKPFDNDVLHARIQANMRRTNMKVNSPGNLLTCTGFSLDAKTHEIIKNGERIPLSATEYRILLHFMQNPNRPFRSSELYRLVWGKPSYGDNRVVIVYVYNLRKKIEENPSEPRYIKNIWGKGYLFDPEGALSAAGS